jgi:tRNA(fMet)-specific endonuclease VapC
VKRFLLDTSGYAHFKRGDEAAVALIDAAEWIGISSVVLGELHAGFLLGSRRASNERELDGFLRNPAVHVLEIDDEASLIYAEIVVALRRAGRPLPTNDLWIAATSAREGAPVVTYDAHFREIERIGSHVLVAC